MKSPRVVLCTGFWCTNIGNAFFSMGVEYVLNEVLGRGRVTLASDLQTYTTGYGKRLYPSKNQLDYISSLDTDYIVLAGPVISKFFLLLWKDTLLKLRDRGVEYIILSAGMMKMTDTAFKECQAFFCECPPYAFSSRDEETYSAFGFFAQNNYNGICFSFFLPDVFTPCSMNALEQYMIFNFDKISEPIIWSGNSRGKRCSTSFQLGQEQFHIKCPRGITAISARTDRFTDALAYAKSLFPTMKHESKVGSYNIIRTDHRFHPHYRKKIYGQANSFCSDLPYGYINLYANATCTLSDRVHACAATLAFGNSAMMFAKTNRIGLLERVGARDVCEHPVKIDGMELNQEKVKMIDWLRGVLKPEANDTGRRSNR